MLYARQRPRCPRAFGRGGPSSREGSIRGCVEREETSVGRVGAATCSSRDIGGGRDSDHGIRGGIVCVVCVEGSLDNAENGRRRLHHSLHSRFRPGTFLRRWRIDDGSVVRGSFADPFVLNSLATLPLYTSLYSSRREHQKTDTMFATRRLAAKVDRSTFKQALKSVNQHQPAPVNQPLRPAKPLLEQLTGEPAPKQSLSDRQAAAAKGKNKSIVDSFRCEWTSFVPAPPFTSFLPLRTLWSITTPRRVRVSKHSF